MTKSFSRKPMQRTALHEAGHLGMALLLGMEVQRCALAPAGEIWRPGELGRCTVLLPDPVGLRRFLLSMGGIMAEEFLLSENRGGLQDRRDALEALRHYLAHYEEPERREELEDLFSRIAAFFSRKEFLDFLRETAEILRKEKILEGPRIRQIAENFPLFPEVFELRQDLESFEKASSGEPWKEWLYGAAKNCWAWLQRFRKPFEEDM
ncbi:MAG TPA: hypothetical protein PLA80_03580 [Synergistaceae bacterium]|nr:hypothetical protein [Synergistaceae bacterium]